MEHTFATPETVDLQIDAGPGQVRIHATETAETRVLLTGKHADKFTVEQHGRTITISSVKRWFVGLDLGPHPVQIEVSLPTGSDVAARLGSADLIAAGALHSCRIKAGSGDISLHEAAELDIYSGSGDVTVSRLTGPGAIRTGSGDIEVGTTTGELSLTSGSGDLLVGRAEAALTTKSGSGDLVVQELGADASLATASGDIAVRRMWSGSLQARTASGNANLAAPAGTPVWTDVSTVSGDVVSRLEQVGQPESDQLFVQWQVRSVSGDVLLQHI